MEMQMRKRKYADAAAELDRRVSSVLTGGGDSEGGGDRRARQPQILDKRVDDVDGDAVQHEGVVASHVPVWVYAPISLPQRMGLLGLLGNPNNTSLYAAYSLASTNHPPPGRGHAQAPAIQARK